MPVRPYVIRTPRLKKVEKAILGLPSFFASQLSYFPLSA